MTFLEAYKLFNVGLKEWAWQLELPWKNANYRKGTFEAYERSLA